MNYLSEAKRMKKKNPEQSQYGASEFEKDQFVSRSKSNYLVVHKDEEFYKNQRKKKLENLLNSDDSNVEKVKVLALESKKIKDEFHRKEELLKVTKDTNLEREAAQLLLVGIQAKMGLMDIYKNEKS